VLMEQAYLEFVHGLLTFEGMVDVADSAANIWQLKMYL